MLRFRNLRWLLPLLLPGCVSLGGTGGSATAPVARVDTTTSVAAAVPQATVPLGPAFQSLSTADRQIAAQAQQQALDSGASGQTVHWRSARSGAQGSVMAGPLYIVNAQRCRDFSHSIEISGRVATDRGVVCREEGSGWQRVG